MPNVETNRRPTLKEIDVRATVLELDGIKGQQKRFLLWLLQQCAQPKVKPTDIVTEEAIDLLAQCLVTPLQVEYYLTLALEHAYRFGEKTVSADVVKALSPRFVLVSKNEGLALRSSGLCLLCHPLGGFDPTALPLGCGVLRRIERGARSES
jgi:hypothetical protein